jgi:hypothetical protein
MPRPHSPVCPALLAALWLGCAPSALPPTTASVGEPSLVGTFDLTHGPDVELLHAAARQCTPLRAVDLTTDVLTEAVAQTDDRILHAMDGLYDAERDRFLVAGFTGLWAVDAADPFGATHVLDIDARTAAAIDARRPWLEVLDDNGRTWHLDPQTLAVDRVSAGAPPDGPASVEARGWVFTPAYGRGVEVREADGQLVATLPTWGSAVDVSATSDHLVIADIDGVTVVDLPDLTVRAHISTPANAMTADLDPASGALWVGDWHYIRQYGVDLEAPAPVAWTSPASDGWMRVDNVGSAELIVATDGEVHLLWPGEAAEIAVPDSGCVVTNDADRGVLETAPADAPPVGRKAPPIEATTLDGARAAVVSDDGPLLVVFWASW